MAAKQVPLVVYENGKRRIIGSATVNADGLNFNVIGTVIDKQYKDLISPNLKYVSVGVKKEA